MEKKLIVNHSELVLHIATLQQEKDIQEYKLKDAFEEIATTRNIVSLFKGDTQRDRPLEIAKTGVNMVLNLITDLVLGKHRSIKGYLSAVMVENFTTMLVDSNLITIISSVRSLFKKKDDVDNGS